MPADERVMPPLPRNFLRCCVLLLLREQPAHGYDLLERLTAFGYDRSDPGAVYRTLRGLEQEGFVRSAWEPSGTGPDRRTYELTRSGTEELHATAKGLAACSEILTSFLSRYEEFVTLRGRRSSRTAHPAADSARSAS